MAAKTSNGTGGGNWSAGATWSGGVMPTTTDTVTIAGGDTVTADSAAMSGGQLLIGSDPGTGGTAAITISGGTTSAILSIAANVVVRLRGDLTMTGAGSPFSSTATLNCAAGSSFILDPPSAGHYLINLTQSCTITCNGTSGSHVIFKTDLGRSGTAGWMSGPLTNAIQGGLITATYTDFSHLGGTTATQASHLAEFGLFSGFVSTTTGTVSITNCTFDNCNYTAYDEISNPSTLNFVFSNNIVTNSITLTGWGGVSATDNFTFSLQGTPTTNTRTVQNNGFDVNSFITFDPMIDYTVTGNVFGGGIDRFTSGETWPNDTYFNNNVIVNSSSTVMNMVFASLKNCYFVLNTGAATLSMQGSTTLTDCVFDAVVTPAYNTLVAMTANTLAIKGTIVTPFSVALPDGYGALAEPTTKTGLTVEHCLQFGDQNYGMVAMGVGGAAAAGCVTSCRANIIWYNAANSFTWLITESGSSTYTLDAVTVAGYNGMFHPTSGSVKYNAGGSTNASVPGYNQIEVTATGNPPANTQVGIGDFTADPTFTDTTWRNFKKWAGTATGGGTATFAVGIATLAANPALITQATTGLLSYIRAGYVPTNASYANTTYGGDTWTTDAAGNAANGTVGPLGFPPVAGGFFRAGTLSLGSGGPFFQSGVNS